MYVAQSARAFLLCAFFLYSSSLIAAPDGFFDSMKVVSSSASLTTTRLTTTLPDVLGRAVPYTTTITLAGVDVAAIAKLVAKRTIQGYMAYELLKSILKDSPLFVDDTVSIPTIIYQGEPSSYPYPYTSLPTVGGGCSSAVGICNSFFVTEVYQRYGASMQLEHCLCEVSFQAAKCFADGADPFGNNHMLNVCQTISCQQNGQYSFYQSRTYGRVIACESPATVYPDKRPATDEEITNQLRKNLDKLNQLLIAALRILDNLSQQLDPNHPASVFSRFRDALQDLVNKADDAKKVYEWRRSIEQAIRDGKTDNQITADNPAPSLSSSSPPATQDVINLLRKQISNQSLTSTDTATQSAIQKAESDITKPRDATTTTTVVNSQGSGSVSVEVNVPTDCDFMPTVCSFIDWVKSSDYSLPDLPEIVFDVRDVVWSSSSYSRSATCPEPLIWSVFSTDISISFDIYCQLAALFKPLLIASAWFWASLILFRSSYR